MRKYFLIVAAFVASMLLTAQANALDVAGLISSSDANSNIEAVGAFVLGVSFGLFAIFVVRRALGK